MTDRELERIDIIKMLIGNIRGIGETNADNKVLENIDFVNEVLIEILEPLVVNAEYEGSVIDDYLKALANPSKIEAAKLSEIATALGIVVDKFTKNIQVGTNSMEEQLKNTKALAEILKKPVPNRDIEDFE